MCRAACLCARRVHEASRANGRRWLFVGVGVSLERRVALVGFARLDDQRAHVFALEEPHERMRQVLETDADVLAVLEPAFLRPTLDVGAGSIGVLHELVHGKAADGHAPIDDLHHVAQARRGRVGVVGRNLPAYGDAALARDVVDHRIENVAADIVEEHVDALRAKLLEACADVLVLVVNCCIGSELLDHEVAFVVTTRNADDAAASDLGDLHDHGTNRTARRRNHDGLTRLGLADPEQPEIRGAAVEVAHRFDDLHFRRLGEDGHGRRIGLENRIVFPQG